MDASVDDLPLDVGEPGLRLGVRPRQRKVPECKCGHMNKGHIIDGRCSACPCPKFQAKPKSPRRKSKVLKAVDVVLKATTEANFQRVIVEIAEANGWWVYHVYDSRRSNPGFPDLLLLRGATMLLLECKSEKGKASPEQEAVIQRLKQVKYVEADIVRPRHADQIAAVLRSAKR